MKLKILISILLIFALVLLVGCGNGAKDSDTDTSSDKPSDSELSTDSDNDVASDSDSDNDLVVDSDSDTTVDSDSDIESDSNTDSELDTETDVDTEADTETDSDTDTDTSTDTDTDTDTDTEPELPPIDLPENETIELLKDNTTGYSLVYDKNSDLIKSEVDSLVAYFKSQFDIDLSVRAIEYGEDIQDKEIIVGALREEIPYRVQGLNKTNDFIIGPSGNDLMIYATSENMYTYAFAILKGYFLNFANEGNLTISPEETFTYSTSSYKNTSYVDYYKKLNGSFDKSKLCDIFEGLTYTASDGTTLPYRIYVPLNYDSSKEYPVVVLLHGAGERGTDNVNQLTHMVADMFNQNKAVIADSIVICPQCPGNNQWVDTPWENGNYSVDNVPESNEIKAVIELIKEVQENYSCDTKRLYAMGLSMGGFGAWDMLMRHTEMFAGAVIMCGGADVTYAEKLKDMPIYTAHDTDDSSVPYSGTEAMVKALRDAGNTNVTFKTTNGKGHVIWQPFAQDPEVIGWLFEQKKQ